MSSRSRNHVIYEFLLLGPSKNIGLAAFLASKTQPNRGFGGPEGAKARILRGLRGCRTMVSEASRRETTYLTWFGRGATRVDPCIKCTRSKLATGEVAAG